MQRARLGISMNYMKLGQYHQFHIRDTYIDALYESGAIPMLVPCLADKELLKAYLKQVQGLVIIGGLDYPPELYGESPYPECDLAHQRRVDSDFMLLETALEMGKPILGICAGMQLLNIYFGGGLIQHIDQLDNHYGEKYHSVGIQNSRWLGRIYSVPEITVNSNHHQAVNPERIGKGLHVVAQAGDGIIEALEYELEQMVLGIQWHPERIADPDLRLKIFQFMAAM